MNNRPGIWTKLKHLDESNNLTNNLTSKHTNTVGTVCKLQYNNFLAYPWQAVCPVWFRWVCTTSSQNACVLWRCVSSIVRCMAAKRQKDICGKQTKSLSCFPACFIGQWKQDLVLAPESMFRLMQHDKFTTLHSSRLRWSKALQLSG